MATEDKSATDRNAPPPSAQMTRRNAMLALLRLGGVAAGAAGVGVWLNERSARPVAAIAEQARPIIASAPTQSSLR